MNRTIKWQQLTSAGLLFSLTCLTANASSFQLWEQDGASVGNYHAGYAALANDASTAFYNPAGITRIKNQQAVFAINGIRTNFKYKGSVTTRGLGTLPNIDVNGGVFAAVPALHYVAPLGDQWGFGFSVDAPFGLKTNYGGRTDMRYAATLSEVEVIDVSPSFAYQINPAWSVGAGFDYQHSSAELDSVASLFYTNPPPGFPDLNTQSTNKAQGHGYGYHAGVLYQYSPCSRAGLSYHSQVKHHLNGNSHFSGGILYNIFTPGHPVLTSDNVNVDVTFPAYTALSAYHKFHPQFAIMGTVIYTQWNVLDNLILRNLAGIDALGMPSTSITVVFPEHYRNTWNLSVGGEYYYSPAITFRAGLGYDQTPVRNTYRDVRLPDNDRYIIAIGGHYQATKALGLDLGWSHFMIKRTNVNPPPLVVGAEQISTNGKVSGAADVVGLQVTWDFV